MRISLHLGSYGVGVLPTSAVPHFYFLFSILISYSILGCRPLQTLNCLLFEQLLHYVPPKFVLESHKKVISCESSYFEPQQLVLKLLCNPQYHTDLHILGTLKFLYSRFLMSPRYFRNVFYFLWYVRFQWFISVLSDGLSRKWWIIDFGQLVLNKLVKSSNSVFLFESF